MDFSTIIEELRALRMEVVALQGRESKSKVVQKTKCQGVTGKGTPCCNGAIMDTEYCKMHTGKIEKPPKVVKAPKAPKVKKIQPEHTHGIGEEVGDCELCQMHGDVIDPELPHSEFDGDLKDFEKFLLNDEEEEYISDLENVEFDDQQLELVERVLHQNDEDDDVSERLRLLLESED